MAFKAICLSCGVASLAVTQATLSQKYCSVLDIESADNCRTFSGGFINFVPHASTSVGADSGTLEDVFEALAVLQKDYFDADYGAWPSAIDWTGAVVETIISGTLTTLSKSLNMLGSNAAESWKAKENLISFYFAQVVNSFFGQDVLSIRGEAYDDILWVVLGWTEALQFIKTHTDLHYPVVDSAGQFSSEGLKEALNSLRWHGHNWVSAFAHRARVFWRLGSGGWDTRYCNGGMVWNRRLLPYKNAITNELWVSASISMFEHFPGDNFTAPWIKDIAYPEKDPVHLAAAIEGYKWLQGINMTNRQGLFVDGYHIDQSKEGNTRCDLRDEMVYTYNQGVILTGHRGLWTASGVASYLEDGHKLIQSVIRATGWALQEDLPIDRPDAVPSGQLPPWRGLGRGGVLEEQCDASGTCSQDGQTFKGIFFHHLTAFCGPLSQPEKAGKSPDVLQYREIRDAHETACSSYLGWVRHNALAALSTRDAEGHFGMWWGASLFGNIMATQENDGIDHSATNTTDYRNAGTPRDETWGLEDAWLPGRGSWDLANVDPRLRPGSGQWILDQHGIIRQRTTETMSTMKDQDPNARGRGRTIETQAGGLAVLRTYWEISEARKLFGQRVTEDGTATNTQESSRLHVQHDAA